ncbi:disease resistance protein RGA2-like isoform X1 [Ziziphus jujuba]|uniref:Disease resistance protein RGA2-like isoform X1 n=2 Tax=Ziziphus jujuba TaxID=326968 RepID=A0ABM4A0T8_ZIZJJ|nr:disease resistance protein RGA2-like isoform X1 [Ziziphus jujuba]XP_048329501.2 disease resistance protein RGA2-like isoform X1 [Ziziphus jujuba]XP_048329502.2 disease resistance protein RGA2-like isoform X1 [Ziziphus jujuba]XP_048329503.2 disease resistance protein RGA2-like isoform X1 [Ziziphus jujuba]XP_060670342.1 disease resistance protein RGA2-like isoform X1 [Ziziphus jujuba]XP_060670343.1 disease resistance protein RGA2-like isoform X1 [Ziziphus jujuba]XP_060670344.1 disease resist
MAEAVLSGIAEGITGQLGNAVVKQIAYLWGVEEELQKLEDTISTIKGVLIDAEKHQVHDEQIKTWLMRLEDAVYEADDLVDEFSTEALLRQVMTGNALVKQVRTFCSTSNQFAFRFKMGKRIRDLRKKLVAIADDRKFHLETGIQEPKVVTRVTTPRVREEDVIGRHREKMEIIKRLFDIETDQENMGVIPIVGVGGLGKTTLAQLVINDAKVKNHFEPIIWVNVPKVFDVELIVKEMVKSRVKDERPMDEMEKELEEKIKGKLYLIVLDDVWDFGNREKWLKLENLLRVGANGSKIIITTRDKNVACKINGQQESTHFLRTLDEEHSWSLFKRLAFMQGQMPDNPNHVKIGKEIMTKCGGIPLVIRTIASMLYSINLEEWSSFKEKELSTIPDYVDDVIPTLKLSYDRLPSHLKHCFGYCSLFPKNHVFSVEMLINLWMAQGFIKLSNDHREDMGYQHFKDLLHRSFFEQVEIDDSFKVTECKMHDCMHDLAMSVTGSKCRMLSLNDKKIDKRTRHVSLDTSLWSPEEEKESLSLLVEMEKIRTLFFTTDLYLSTRILKKSILSCKFLRTLDLHAAYARLTVMPKSIGKLKHLRYLDLSWNDMQALPNSITRLQHLQTLNLSSCWKLRALPYSISRLQNLQTLNLSYCGNLGALPDTISRLQNLQTLNLNQCWNLQALPNDVTKLVSLRSLGMGNWLDSTLYYRPSGLVQLTIRDYGREHLIQIPSVPPNTDSRFFIVFSKLENLNIDNIQDLQHLPVWFESLSSLQKLSISRCSKLQSLSPGLHHLTSLQRLSISWCEVLDMSNGGSDDAILWQAFGRLSYLSCSHLPKLQHLPVWFKNFPSLKELSISCCSKLQSLSPCLHHLTSLQRLSITDCEELDMSNGDGGDAILRQHLGSLSYLWLRGLPKLQHLPMWFKSLTSLEKLYISFCSKLQSLSPGLYHLTSLQKLDISWCEELNMENGVSDDAILWQCLRNLYRLELNRLPKLVALPQGLQQVTSLQEITISSCENLEAVLEHITNLKSLKELTIWRCSNLKSLPEGINCLPSLQELKIIYCPILLERCQKDIGDYWAMISHIRRLELSPMTEGLHTVI